MPAPKAAPVFHFSHFRDFIRTELPAARKAGPRYTGDFLARVTALKEAGKQALQGIRYDMIHYSSRDEIIGFLRHQQHIITSLADELLPLLREGHIVRVHRCSGTPSVTNLVKHCYNCLEDQMIQLNEFHPGLMSDDVQMPQLYFRKHQYHLDLKMNYYTQELITNDADLELVALAMFPLEEFLASRANDYSSIQFVGYYDRFFREMEDLLESKDTRRTLSRRLFRRMYYLNHNSTRFYLYCQAYCRQKIDAEDTPDEKLLAIQKLQAKMLELPQEPGLALRTDRSSLSEKLTALLQSEKDILLHEQSLQGREPTAFEQKELLQSEWSQPVWGSLLKAIKETGGLKNKEVLPICRTFAGILINNKGKVASGKGFSNDYNHTDLSVCDELIDKLQEMINFTMREKIRIKHLP